ncbi:MAG: T9SS type A sorting domain-containing protein [Bacteroidia bacterium]
MKKSLLPFMLGLVFMSFQLNAQDWVQMMQDPNVNFYDVQKAFNKYWAKEERNASLRRLVGGKESQSAEENYEKYKRWEYFTEQRVYPSGDRSLIRKGAQEIQDHFVTSSKRSPSSITMAGNWSLLGPTTQISAGGGAGRVNVVRFDPSNPSTIYAGAPSGGLWKSTNNGLTWTTNTDRLSVLGISDIAVDPTNPNTIYVATGDCDAGDSYSIGVLKSTDGGLTWNATGLSFNIVDTRKTFCLIINPKNHLELFAGTGNGIFKTMDGGVSWAKTLGAPARDIKFKPNDTTVVYAISAGSFYRSTNTGNSFTPVATGLPAASAVSRLAIAVTPADNTYIYILASNATSFNYNGVYQSTDQGLTFTKKSSSPNLLGFNQNGSDTGGQGWYTLTIAASPTNKSEIITGGVNVWRSVNAGVSWSVNSSWTGWGGPYVHADIHCLTYLPGSGTTYFAGCDGGLFKTANSGSAWTDLSNGLQIGEMYRLGCSQSNPNMVVQGWQDNGTSQYLSTATPVWSQVLGGDGMECFIDYSNANIAYGEQYNGSLNRTTNNWGSSTSINNNITGTGAWVTPWCQDPVTPATIYAGFQEVWKSTSRGNSWTAISAFGGNSMTVLAVAKSNPQYIYAGGPSNLFATANGGTTWTNLTTKLPGTGTITHVDISTIDPKVIWITYSGYTANSKIFKSKDAGITWTNLSTGLPNIPANCSIYQPGTADGLYVGTDVGVYYTDTVIGNWVFYSAGLPNVVVDELEIVYSAKKLRAATYGRGLWETGLYDPTSTLPLANFKANVNMVCPGDSIQFTDMSTNNPTSWNWYFANGTPNSSTAQNPVIHYNAQGTYNLVKLTATNANGSDSVTRYAYIGVSPMATPIITLSGKDTICAGGALVLASSFGTSYSWSPGGSTNGSIAPSSSGSYIVTVTDAYGCKASSLPKSVVINPVPNPIITQHGDTLFSSISSGNQWYLGSTAIAGATGSYVVMNGTGAYSVHVTDANGCKGTSNIILGINENSPLENAMSVYPNPNNGLFTLSLTLNDHAEYLLRITDVAGRMVYEEKLVVNGPLEHAIDLNTFGKGMYLLELSGLKGRAVKKLIVD